MNCDRCHVEMNLRPLYEGGETEAWYCPCCRWRVRTPEMIGRDAQKRMGELGMNEEEYHDYTRSFFRTYPLTEQELQHARAFAEKAASDWTPTCEHDENPWQNKKPRPSYGASEEIER